MPKGRDVLWGFRVQWNIDQWSGIVSIYLVWISVLYNTILLKRSSRINLTELFSPRMLRVRNCVLILNLVLKQIGHEPIILIIIWERKQINTSLITWCLNYFSPKVKLRPLLLSKVLGPLMRFFIWLQSERAVEMMPEMVSVEPQRICL